MRKPIRHMATTPEGLDLVSSSFGRRANEGSCTYSHHRNSHLSNRGPQIPGGSTNWDVKDAQGCKYPYGSHEGSMRELPEVSG